MLKKALIKLICTFGLVLLVSSCGNIMSRNLNSDDVGNNQNENTNNNNSESSDFEKYFHFTSELEEGLLFTLTDASEYPVGNECTPDFEFDGFIDYYMKLIRQEGLLSGQLMFKGDSTCFILMNFNTEQLFELVYAEEGSEMSGYLYNEEEETFTVLYDPKVPPVFMDLEVTTGAEYISLEAPSFFVGNPSTVFAYIGLEGTISINGSSVIGYFDFADMNEQGYQFSSLTPETAYRIIVVAENSEGYTVSETVQTTLTCNLLPELAVPDAGLLSVIRTVISKPTGDICREDLAALKTFSAPSSNIIDVTGLEYFISLERLDLRQNQIVDISSLSGLTSLRDLSLEYNQIVDISSLSGLTGLRYLAIESNPLVDISSLSGLTGLRDLYLRSNQIIDISSLSGLTGLRSLYLWGNQIIDISDLSELTNLRQLDLSSNQIVDISSLSGLTSLYYLELSNNQIVDISNLSGLTSLRDLRLMGNQIVNISSLSGLTGLSGLDLRSNQIVDISILSGLTNLTQLQLYSNQIVDISSLSGLTSLSYLELSNNQIVSITPLMTNFWAGGLVGASVSLSTNNLDAQALSDAQTLLDNGVNISW